MIVGAGLAGLIAGHAFPNMPIVEAMEEPSAIHKALLRFRSNEIARLTGIDFKPVTVRKGIWYQGDWVKPNPCVCNQYAAKVLGRIHDRSIWDISTQTRYIAPDDFYERLVDTMSARIEWGTRADFNAAEPIISTAPMEIVLNELNRTIRQSFKRAPIHVERFKVIACDVYQTVYFPQEDQFVYRASITGDTLIVEFTEGQSDKDWLYDVLPAFGLSAADIQHMERADQKYGKIAPIDEAARHKAIEMLTNDYEIYSLGRFATWRNILLDDLARDIDVIKNLITASSYERKLISAKRG